MGVRNKMRGDEIERCQRKTKPVYEKVDRGADGLEGGRGGGTGGGDGPSHGLGAAFSRMTSNSDSSDTPSRAYPLREGALLLLGEAARPLRPVTCLQGSPRRCARTPSASVSV